MKASSRWLTWCPTAEPFLIAWCDAAAGACLTAGAPPPNHWDAKELIALFCLGWAWAGPSAGYRGFSVQAAEDKDVQSLISPCDLPSQNKQK